MKRAYKFTACFLIIILMGLTGGSTSASKEEKSNEINALKDMVSEERLDFTSRTSNLKPEYINWYEKGKEDISKEEIKAAAECTVKYNNNNILNLKASVPYDGNKELTCDEAVEDVEVLFKYLRYGYGAYGYFGGDGKFNFVKENIIDVLKSLNNISAENLKDIMVESLSFIKDAHFQIYGQGTPFIDTAEKSKYYYIYKDEFLKDSKGYYKEKDKKKYYVTSINKDCDVEKNMHVTINKDGRLIYNIAFLGDYSKSSDMDCLIEYNDKEPEKVKINMSNRRKLNSEEAYKFEIKDGIARLSLRRFFNISVSDTSQTEFLESADKLKESKAAVIDLRGNIGGSPNTGDTWIEKYIGKDLTIRGAWLTLNSSLIKEIYQRCYSGAIGSNPFERKNSQGLTGEKIDNDRPIFVLVDKHTASAAETFIESLMNIDNVFIVGTNTGGYSIGVGVNFYSLPNSSLVFEFGNILYLSPYDEDFEFSGFKPDILLDYDDADERVVKMIKYYGLDK